MDNKNCSYAHFAVFLAITLTYQIHANSMSFDVNDLTWEQEIHVDQHGSGDFGSIQEAIDSIPSRNRNWIMIRIEPGIYSEKIIVPIDKPHIILSGRDASTTIITGNNGGGLKLSPVVSVFAWNFIGQYLTIENKHDAGEQAVALRVAGDKVAFYSSRILGYQDTLFDDSGRHYYKNCYIEGAIDFICGNAASLYDNCHIHSISRGVITAQKRESREEKTGFYFTHCKITGAETCYLGRPWGVYSRVVFIDTYMSSAVLPDGWDDWKKPYTHRTVYYGEHDCYGPGANRSSRVPWSRDLTYDEALPHFCFHGDS